MDQNKKNAVVIGSGFGGLFFKELEKPADALQLGCHGIFQVRHPGCLTLGGQDRRAHGEERIHAMGAARDDSDAHGKNHRRRQRPDDILDARPEMQGARHFRADPPLGKERQPGVTLGRREKP